MAKRTNQDKSAIFMYYWRIYAPNAPLPEPEYKFSAIIKRKHRFDWAWPTFRIAVEVDGGAWKPHGGRHAGDKDREKLNIASSLNWRVFRFSPQMLEENPEHCVTIVLNAIQDAKNNKIMIE